jgi:ribosomal protein S18 acetylase RimI-like enzyme
MMSQITIEVLMPDRESEAAHVLARAFVTNPLHISVFGPHNLASNEVFFKVGLRAMKGPKFAALDGRRIVGVVHWVHSPKCQFASSEKVKTLPTMVKGFGLRSTLKVVRWLSAWSKHDPAERHCHLGPIGVLPEAQGRGIGRQLMEQYCTEVDRTGDVGYLETDRPENVAFYGKSGFEISRTASIEGVLNYFMRRESCR